MKVATEAIYSVALFFEICVSNFQNKERISVKEIVFLSTSE